MTSRSCGWRFCKNRRHTGEGRYPARCVCNANESTGVYVRGFVKITDPESGQVIVETAN